MSAPYSVIGVKDPDKLQKDLSSQCADMFNHPVRPTIEPDVIDGKKVLVVTVLELDNRHKPLYFKNEGLPRGAWRRIGSIDQRCTEEDLAVFYTDSDSFDRGIAEDTDLDDIDENAVRYYRKLREEANPDAEELKYSDHSRNQFTTRILLHHLLPEEDVRLLACLNYDLTDNQKTALIFMREVGAVDNITYRQLTGVSAREAAAEIKQIESYDLIKLHGQGRRAYYTPTEKLMALLAKGVTSDANNATGYADNVPSSRPNVPSSLQTKIDNLGIRVPLSQLQELVIELCKANPYSASELAQILNRTEYHAIKRIIRPLVKEKKLFYTIPEMINHPQQKYTSIPKQRSEVDGINR